MRFYLIPVFEDSLYLCVCVCILSCGLFSTYCIPYIPSSPFPLATQEFKNKLKAGSGVRFDLKGLPLLDEGDPVVQATRQSKVGQRQCKMRPSPPPPPRLLLP